MKCLDHVIPRVQFGRNSYRNLVSACMERNSAKKEHSAADYIRSLYRDGRLTATGTTSPPANSAPSFRGRGTIGKTGHVK